MLNTKMSDLTDNLYFKTCISFTSCYFPVLSSDPFGSTSPFQLTGIAARTAFDLLEAEGVLLPLDDPPPPSITILVRVGTECMR
jgi:hypothetical protein